MDLVDFARSGHFPTLLISFLYFAVSFMVWTLIGVLAVPIAADLGMTPSQTGWMVALPLLTGALARIPLGMMADRVGPKRTGLVTQCIAMAALLAIWQWGRSRIGLNGFGLLLGIAGGSFAVALPLAGRWYPPRHQGLVMGIAGAGNCGTAVAALIAPALAQSIGWRGVCGLALVPAAVVLILYLFFAQEAPAPPSPKSLRSYLALCREPDTLWFCLFYGFTFGGFLGLVSYLMILLSEPYGLSQGVAGVGTALCVFAGSLVRPVGGWLADRFGGVRLLRVLIPTASLGLAALALLPPPGFATLLWSAVLACLGMGNGAVFQLVPRRFPRETGTVTGLVGAVGGLGGFGLPVLFGCLKDATGSYSAGLLAFGVVGIVCTALLLVVQRAWRVSWLAAEART